MFLMVIVVGLVAALGLVLLIGVLLYNSLVGLRLRARSAWSQIAVQLKRRHDLIPNLVETVKGFAAHERQTLEAVVKARSQAVDARSAEDQVRAENELTKTLRSLMMVVENYPAIKANQNFLALQEELTTTENRVAFARRHYNDETTRYNTSVGAVPQNFIARSFGFLEMPFFELESPEDKRIPDVKF
jgi:LemA protein